MATITREEVERIAALARLALTPEEAGRMTRELAQVLDYVGQLSELDLADVEPTLSAIPVTGALREDCVRPSFAPERAVAGGPRVHATAFVVPKVIEGDEG